MDVFLTLNSEPPKKNMFFWGVSLLKRKRLVLEGLSGGEELFPKFERCHSRSFVNFKSCLHPVLAILWVSPRDLFGIAVSFIRHPFFWSQKAMSNRMVTLQFLLFFGG